MPWNNQSGGGGWKSGGGGGGGGGPWGGGPWGQGPSGGGGGGQQPDLEEILKRGQDRLKQVMPGSGLPGPLIVLLGAVAFAVFSFYAFTFRVNPDELGVVMRFGQFVRQEPPGLHFRWPYPIEEIRQPPVTRQNIIEIGRRTPATGRGPVQDSGLMLTGDENIVDMTFVVYWRIKTEVDPKTRQPCVAQFLFNIAQPEITVREVAESAMREVVGQSNLQPLLTEGRQKIELSVQKLMQDTLDSYGAGIRVDQIQLKEVDPPAAVISAFRDVQAAVADRERFQKEAQTYADQIVPRARGEAERILAGANGYREQTVAEATGQTSRFLKIYEEYKKAPEVTRRRMFIEMQERVLTGSDKIILDNSGGQGVMPYLPLDQTFRRPGTPGQGGN
jgi:membrane protease subunit HflK